MGHRPQDAFFSNHNDVEEGSERGGRGRDVERTVKSSAAGRKWRFSAAVFAGICLTISAIVLLISGDSDAATRPGQLLLEQAKDAAVQELQAQEPEPARNALNGQQTSMPGIPPMPSFSAIISGGRAHQLKESAAGAVAPEQRSLDVSHQSLVVATPANGTDIAVMGAPSAVAPASTGTAGPPPAEPCNSWRCATPNPKEVPVVKHVAENVTYNVTARKAEVDDEGDAWMAPTPPGMCQRGASETLSECPILGVQGWLKVAKFPLDNSPQEANGCVALNCRSVRRRDQGWYSWKRLKSRMKQFLHSVEVEIQTRLLWDSAKTLHSRGFEKVDDDEHVSWVRGCMYRHMWCRSQLMAAQSECRDDEHWIRSVENFTCTGGREDVKDELKGLLFSFWNLVVWSFVLTLMLCGVAWSIRSRRKAEMLNLASGDMGKYVRGSREIVRVTL